MALGRLSVALNSPRPIHTCGIEQMMHSPVEELLRGLLRGSLVVCWALGQPRLRPGHECGALTGQGAHVSRDVPPLREQ